LRYAASSGGCSIAYRRTADSVERCSPPLRVRLGSEKNPPRRETDTRVHRTWRSLIRRDEKRAVPPFPLAEKHRIRVLPQFPTMVWASASPQVPGTRAIDWEPRTQRPPTLRRRVRASLSPSTTTQ
jgi:hypothetical protein